MVNRILVLAALTWATIPLDSCIAAADESGIAAADELGIVRIRSVTSDYVGISSSTGTHLGDGWVLTCGHCSDSTAYGRRVEVRILSAATWKPTRRVRGVVVYSDAEADLGLVRLEPGHELQTSYRLAPRDYQTARGDKVIAYEWQINDSGEMLYSRTRFVTHVNRYLGPENIETTGRPQGGSSGGPLVSARDGFIIGVTRGAFVDENRGLYTAIGEIYRAIDQQRRNEQLTLR